MIPHCPTCTCPKVHVGEELSKGKRLQKIIARRYAIQKRLKAKKLKEEQERASQLGNLIN